MMNLPRYRHQILADPEFNGDEVSAARKALKTEHWTISMTFVWINIMSIVHLLGAAGACLLIRQ